MTDLTVEINQVQLAEVQALLSYIKNGTSIAMARALNKTASKARTESSKAIRQQIRFTASYLNERDTEGRRRLSGPSDAFEYRANKTSLVARVVARRRGTRLDRFHVSGYEPIRSGWPPAPIIVQVKQSGWRAVLQNVFWVQAKNSGGYLIAMKNAAALAAGKTKLTGNKSYQVLHTSSVHDALENVKDQVGAALTRYLADALERETAWLISQNPPPAGDGSTEDK